MILKISKITGCTLENIGQLDFDFEQGACNTFSFGIMLCFPYSGTKMCKS